MTVVRGYLARQKSKKLAALREKECKDVQSLLEMVTESSALLEMRLRQTCSVDDEQRQLSLKKEQ